MGSTSGRQVSELLASDKANFSVRAGEVASSTIEPAARLGAHGPHVGQWLLKTADGTSHDFQFEDVTEMGKAIAALEGLLGAMQRVNVRWDEKNGRYAKLA